MSSDKRVQRELAGFSVAVAAQGLVTFEVDETHEFWEEIRAWAARRDATDIVTTKFSKKEVREAAWLELVPEWHHGYPQPDSGSFGYRAVTYELRAHCEQCGAGLSQRAPFQMKGEPKWGRHNIMQLNWVFDEFFVQPDLWARALERFGIGTREVTDRLGAPLSTVVQLEVKETVSVRMEGFPSEECPSCGSSRFLPVTRGFFPPLAEVPSGPVVRTAEYFGSGSASHRRVLVSQAVASSLVEEKMRGASLRPVSAS